MNNLGHTLKGLLVAALLGCAILTAGLATPLLADDPIKVGIFQNRPIVFFEGEPQGLFVEVLNEVAEKEKWQLQYVQCELNDCLQQLASGKLDLMTSLGESPERLAQFAFSREPVWTFWGTIHARDIAIQGILDLRGKTIGVRKNNNTTAALQKLLNDFGISVNYIEFDNYEDAFASIQQGTIDAVAANNTYVFDQKTDVPLYRTPIVFNPFPAYFAAPKGGLHADKLQVIDNHVERFRDDPESVLHAFTRKWFGHEQPYWTTRKIITLILAVILPSICGMAWWRYRSLVALNQELAHNVAVRKNSEHELRKSEEQLLEAQEIARIGRWELDLSSGHLLWSEGLYSLFEVDKETFAASYDGFLEFVHPEDRTAVDQAYRDSIRNRTPYSIEHRFLMPDGRIKWVNEIGRTEYDAAGVSIRSIGIVQDITERKSVEEEQHRLQQQLIQAQKMESVGRLAGGIAHDFNNMLNVILGRAEMILEALPDSSPVREDLKEIQEAASRSADLTRQLLAFARKQTVAPRSIDLNATVDGMLKILRRLIGEGIDLAWLPRGNTARVTIDITQLEQLLANLCVNARDSIDDTGKITIETDLVVFDDRYCADHPGFQPGEYVLLSVSDNGCGMSPETMSHLFEPFFTTKELGQGTGLGLATVYGIVKQNKGFINVYSEPGQGTTFRIYLCRDTGDTGAFEEAGSGGSAIGGDETILLVEDEPKILDLARTMLQRQGYTVLAANTPGDALRIAREHGGMIHLLVTDVIMPEMNGRELATRLATIFPSVKTLFMSGYTANVIARHGVLDEGIHFIQKPFSSVDLGRRVREALQG